MRNIRGLVQNILQPFGYRLQSLKPVGEDPLFTKLHAEIGSHTMTSRANQHALFDAVRYLVRSKIPGDFVECGVWRGGSAMLAAYVLQAEEDTTRTLYLYDTYAGMSEPTEDDINLHGSAAIARWHASQKDDINEWDYAPLSVVQENIEATGYPKEKVSYVVGKVEDTIPGTIPETIALLRLDTDWYESTKHELVHLFPRLVTGGVLILDDYGHWQGARKAVDEYLVESGIALHLVRVDYTGRVAVKL